MGLSKKRYLAAGKQGERRLASREVLQDGCYHLRTFSNPVSVMGLHSVMLNAWGCSRGVHAPEDSGVEHPVQHILTDTSVSTAQPDHCHQAMQTPHPPPQLCFCACVV